MASAIQEKEIFSGSYKDWPLIVRQATQADYDDVMNICKDVGEGADYLPLTYNAMIKDPMAYPFLVESDGRVV